MRGKKKDLQEIKKLNAPISDYNNRNTSSIDTSLKKNLYNIQWHKSKIQWKKKIRQKKISRKDLQNGFPRIKLEKSSESDRIDPEIIKRMGEEGSRMVYGATQNNIE